MPTPSPVAAAARSCPLAHRYIRPAKPQPVKVDVLAPEGLGLRADLTTTKPGRTVEVEPAVFDNPKNRRTVRLMAAG